ncbi:O-antigen ligase family protein [Kitasatospora sp. NPDC127111]|uniref:O-antigen ligase family protein n=1 Tax=Kitasatospora sp. NPDC127111 TaxID=3345363 RepID=UPI00362B9BF0
MALTLSAVPRPARALRRAWTAPLERPSLLAAATVLLVCVPTGEKDVTAAVHVTAADLASLALVALTAVNLLRGRTPAIGRTAAVRFGAVVVAAAVATIGSIDPATSVTGFVRLTQVFVLVPAAVLCSLRDRTDHRLVLGSFVAAALIEGAVGAHQYLTRTGASYAGQPVRAVGTFGALDIMAMSTVVSYGLLAALALALGSREPKNALPSKATGDQRAVGVLPAEGMGRAAVRGASTAGQSTAGQERPEANGGDGERAGDARLRRAMYAAAAFLAFPLAVSFSRGSWIATGAAAAVLLLRADARLAVRSAVLGLAAAVVLVGGLGLGASGITDRLSSIGSVSAAPDQSVSDRYDLWATAERIWQDHPVSGAGPKAFQQLRDSHAPLRLSSGSDAADATIGFQREPLLSPHNMYFLVLSEQGLIGIVAYAVLFLGLLLGCLRRATGPGLAALALLVWVLVDFLYADIGGTTTVLTSVVLGLAARAARARPERPGPSSQTGKAPTR